MPAQRFVASRILSAEVCSKWNDGNLLAAQLLECTAEKVRQIRP